MLSLTMKIVFFMLMSFTFTYGMFGQMDTMRYISHTTAKSEITDGSTTQNISYTVDGKKASKKQYDKAVAESNTISDCTPCWLIFYDCKGQLYQEGLFYQDCPMGKITAYYTSGKIKTTGAYVENLTADWSDMYNRGFCTAKDGEWIYYNEDGSVKKIEVFDKGKLIESK